MSWDEYKKYREDLKKKKEKLNIDLPTVGAVKNPVEKYTKDIKASITTKAKSNTNNVRLVIKDEVKNAKTYVPLWDKIKKMAGNAGRTGQNTYLGAKVGGKDMTNYMYETANSSLNSHMPFKERQEKMNKVMISKELSQEEKNAYFMIETAKQKASKMPINNKSALKPLLPIKQSEEIDYKKIEEVANKNAYLDSIKEDEKKIQENIEKQDGVVSKKLAELAPSIGNMGVGAVASAVNPIAGATYFGMSAGGSYMRDGLDRGMSKEEAINYGTIMGIMEGATEAVGVGMFSKAGKTLKTVIKGAGKEVVKEGAEQVGKASIKQALKQYGIGIADNVMQESLIEPIQEITAGAIGGKDKANWNNMGNRMLQAGINGGLTGAIVGGANLGLSSCTGVIEKARNGQQVTQEEIQTAVKDASKELDVQKMIVDSTQQQVDKYKNNTQNLQQNATTEQNNISTQQINQEENKVAQNGMSQEQKLNNNQNIQNTQYKKYNVKEIPEKNGIAFQVDSDIMDIVGHIPNNGNMPFIDQIFYSNKVSEDSYNEQSIPKEYLRKGNATNHILSTLNYFKSKGINEFQVKTMNENSNALMESLVRKGYIEQLSDYKYLGDDVTYKINNQTIANNQETLYNNIALGETKNVPIEEILPLQTSGGYRTQSEMANLKEDIAKNGIQNPIELAKRNDGTIEIENGNHRLMIAKELGLKEVPIKFVEGWENVGKNVDKTESKFVENWEKSYDRNNRNGATINKYNVRDGIIEGDGANNRNEFENGTTTERNDIVPNKIQTYNDRPSSSATSEQSIKELEEPSSFSMQDNKDLSYQGNNRASGKAYGKNITVDKMTTEVEKIKEKYSKVIDSKDNEAIAQINKVKDNPDAEITIYRGSPNGEINVGDWVFLTRERAQDYTRTKITKTPIPGYSVGELKVKARDVDWTGKNLEFVYNPQSIDNPDIRYSLPTKDWNKYLNKNFKTTGTTTNLNEIKLPTQKKPDNSQNTVMSNIKKYNKYKQNILNRRADEINSLISYKNESLRNIENKINEKQTLLNSKNNQNTKVATNIKSQIERLKSQKAKIENLYNEKIDKVNKKTNKEKIDFETRNTMKQLARENLRAEISPLTEDLTKFKDKKKGILYKRETAQRNIEDIVQDKELAQAINDTIFNPIQKHHAEKTREINKLFSTINDLKLDKNKVYDYVPKETGKSIKIDEATFAQLLIEKKMSKEDLKNKYKMSKEQIEKIDKTANTFSEILDYLYNKMNEEQIKFGYAPIGKIKNYFPHFFENKPDTMLGKIASYFGIDTTNQDLPTEIAGITDTFKPGKTWNSNTLKRKTNKTDYDALKAMEKYIIGASDIIYTTEDIQRVREFEREIRYKYSDKGIQEQVDKIYNDKDLTQDAKEIAIKSILENTGSELPNFVTWLNEYGNVLANKKSFSDRSMEQDLGRNMYSTMKGIEGRIASNTIGGNLSVSLTNFAPLFQSMGTTDFRYVLTGALQTTINDIKGIVGKKDIDFVNNSTFLTNRFGTNTISKQTVTQNISNVASVPMNIIDAFTSESIVRAKYLENLDNGMTEEQALDNADKYASRLMADRSKGALPIAFNSKNPLSKLITMFQVEPNNIVSNYLKDMPKNADGKIDLTYQATKLMVASWAFNTIAMAVRGGNEVLPDPIRWVSYLIKSIFGEDEEEKEKATKDLAESIIGSIPFASNIAGFGLNDLFGLDSDVGRIPVSNAMPSLTNIVKSIDKDANPEYRKELLTKELTKPLIYLGLPTGGAQLKKTVEGISTVYKGGSYKTDNKGNKKLQFPVENATAKDYIQAGVFGKYSLPVAKQYADRGFKTLSAKQTKTYQDANLPYKEYIEYLDAGLKKTTDKIEYIKSKDMTIEQKWGIYKNDIFSSKDRDDGGSQLKDAEYITSNGVSKEKYIKIYNKALKNNIKMPTESEYKELKKEGISLDKYMDYKIDVKNKTKKKQKDEKDEDAKLNNKEQIQILIESNYSKKDKTALYEKYIKSKEDSNYDVMKVAGIDIDEILKYKQQDFKSDKKDDGTLQGKTANKSKQKKVVNYLNSMNITKNQRLLLYAMNEYTTTSSQKNQLAKYVYGLDLKQKEKLELYSKFQGFTVYKNGIVKW